MKEIRESEWFGARAAARSRSRPHPTRGLGALTMRVVFAGTPEVALPALDAIAASPPRAGRRGHPARRPGRPRAASCRRRPVAAARRGARRTRAQADAPARPGVPGRAARAGAGLLPGRRLRRAAPQSALDIPAHGWVNLHFSVLPAWRGAAPVQHAIWAGDEVTGATTFRIVEELDAGPDLRRDDRDASGPTTPPATCSAGWPRAAPGCWSRPSTASRTGRSRRASSRPRASASRPRSRSTTRGSTGREPAVAVDRRIRACTPGPGAWTTYDGERIKLGPVTVDPDDADLAPGVLEVTKNAVLVGTATRAVRLGEVKALGRKQMPAADWARGVRFARRRRLGDREP